MIRFFTLFILCLPLLADATEDREGTVDYPESEVFMLSGILHETVCPGPPHFNDTEISPEQVFILRLNAPIKIEVYDVPNEFWRVTKQKLDKPHKTATYARMIQDLQVVFSDTVPSSHDMKIEIDFRGTIYPATTPHHHEEFALDVISWSARPQSEKSAL